MADRAGLPRTLPLTGILDLAPITVGAWGIAAACMDFDQRHDVGQSMAIDREEPQPDRKAHMLLRLVVYPTITGLTRGGEALVDGGFAGNADAGTVDRRRLGR